MKERVRFFGPKWLGASLVVGLLAPALGSAIFVGWVILSNRSVSVYHWPQSYNITFPTGLVTRATMSGTPGASENIRLTNTVWWYDHLVARVDAADRELSMLTYSICEWQFVLTELRSTTICVVKRSPPPTELREAIQRGRQLLATAR